MIPPPLHPGDTISIFAPSSRVNRDTTEKATGFLEQRGYVVHVHPQTFTARNQSAGTAAEKCAALHDLWADPAIKAIICAGGGNRASDMLENLNDDLIRATPKILMGYSDATALLNAVTAKTGLTTFHGPMLNNIVNLPPEQTDHCFKLLAGKTTALPLTGAATLKDGTAKGTLIGGNLSLLCSLLGTPWQPDFENAILFVEDCGDELSRFDRMFLQLRNAAIHKKIAGLVVGQFTNVKDTGKMPFGFTLEDIVREHTARLNIPVIMNAPFGHGTDLVTFPIGAQAKLEADTKRSKLTLTG